MRPAGTAPCLLPADLLGLNGDCDGSNHGGQGAQAALAGDGSASVAVAAAAAVAAAGGQGEGSGTSPRMPSSKRVRLELPGGSAAAAAAAMGAALVASSCPPRRGPQGGASRLERELEKALRAFIRLK